MKTFGVTDYTNLVPLKCCGRTDGQTDGRTDRRTDGQTDGRLDGRSGPTTRPAFTKATQVKMPTAPDLRKRMKFWHFLKGLQNSWNLQNLLESPPETCMWNLKQFGEVSILDKKMLTAPDLRKRMKFWHFLKVLRNSWNLQNLLESPPGTCMWNLKQFGEVSIFDRKMLTAPDLRKRMKFWHFLKVLQNSRNLQNLLESLPGKCIWNLKQFGEVSIFDRKMPTAPDLRKNEILTFLKVLRNSWNLQNLLESPPGTCMCNLKQFGEVSIFDRKMPTAPDLRKRMKFWHFLKVLRNSWNLQNLLESPPGTCMWNLEEFGEVSIFDRKMPTAPDLRKRMNFWHFLKGLQNSWNLQNLLESPPGTCMCNLKQFGKVSIFDRKMPTAPDLRKRMNFWHFLKVLQNSWNLQNLLESPPGTCMWNLKQFGEVSIFDRKMPTAPDLRKRMKFWHFLKVLRNSWNLQNLLESPSGTCMWNLKQFGEVSIFDRKMPTAPDLRKRMKFWHFLKVSKIHETYRIYWNHLQEHACEIEAVWRSFNFWQKNADSAGP